MSLAVLADHMASKGRNGDTMLVHMTPGEVQGLQALALAHGGSLSINPETGLVEASWLKKLLPVLAGMALNTILPGAGLAVGAALGITGAAAGAIGTGLIVGGVTGLATGSLRQGIVAGLGAYGGASLMGGIEAAGAAGAQQAAMTPEAVAQVTGPELVGNATAEAVAKNQLAEQATRDYLAKGATDRLASGIGALGSEAGRTAALQSVGGASGAMRAGMMAAAPVMADAMVPTATAMPSLNQYPGMVRPFTYDPYSQSYTPQEPYKAAAGGIVALADGGSLPGLREGTQLVDGRYFRSDNELNRSEKIANLLAGAEASAREGMLQQYAANPYIGADILSEGTRLAGILGVMPGATRTALPPPPAPQPIAQAAPSGLAALAAPAPAPVAEPAPMQISAQTAPSPYAAQIAAGQEAIPYATGARASREEIGQIYQDLLKREADPGGLEFYYASQFSPERIRENIRQSEEYRNRPVTGPTIAPTGTPTSAAPGPVTGGTVTPGTTETVGGGQPITVSPVAVDTVPGYTGADRTYGGTETIAPPAAPPASTTGRVTQDTPTMQEVRAAYEQGGGSTGPKQTPFTPTPMTGGSKAAFDYLMGRGAYPTVPYTQTGEIMRPYAEAVLGMPVDKTRSKYIFDPTTRQYVPNPDYKAPTFPNVPGTNAGGQPIIRDPAGNPYTGNAAAYFAANPDVKQAYETQVTGMTPEAYAEYHWDTFGKNEGRKGYPEVVNSAPIGGGSKEPNADIVPFARGGLSDIAAAAAAGGGQFNLGGYSDGGRLLRGPGDGVSDSIPATIGGKQPARLADGEFVIPARIVSEIGNGSTEAGARKLYAMMDRVQRARAKTTGKGRVAKDTNADKYLPA